MAFSWSLADIAKTLDTHPKLCAQDLSLDLKSTQVSGLTTDSRSVQSGNFFAAIRGDQFDGHDFIPQAIEHGATAILTQEPIPPLPGVAIFQVSSTLNALRELATRHREKFSIPVIAVVGSVGKTTTKEMLSALLSGKYSSTLKTDQSQNGYLGIPLTLLRLNSSHQAAVIEIGIDEIGAMDDHLPLVKPTHIVLTATGPEHLHQLKTTAIAAEEELRSFDYSVSHQIPLAIHLHDVYVQEWLLHHLTHLQKGHHLGFILKENQPALPQSISETPLSVLTGEYSSKTETLKIESPQWAEIFSCPLPGKHHAQNLLAAMTTAVLLELSLEELKNGLKNFQSASGRTNIHQLPNQIEVIADHYNSNPTSARAAIELLAQRAGTHSTHAVLGDMLELGENEEAFHRELALPILEHHIQHVWLYGPRMQWLHDELNQRNYTSVHHFQHHSSLTKALQGHLQTQIKTAHYILIKGSRGMKMENVLNPLLNESVSAQ